MKYYKTAGLILLSILTSCNIADKDIKVPPPNTRMVPRLDDNQNTPEDFPENTLAEREEILPHIPIGADYKVVTIIESNLDTGQDDDDEQIILLQPVSDDNPSSFLEIWIAEFRPNRNEYILSWKSKLQCELPETAAVQVRNIAGSRENEILVTGFTKENYQTLDIFLNEDKVSKFRNIFSTSARGSIEIEYQEYLGDRGNSAITILTNETDYDANNQLVIVNTVWALNRNTQFVKVSQSSKLQDEQQKEEIVNILKGDEDSFVNFLNGFWYKEDSFSEDGNRSLFYIDAEDSSVIFYNDNEFELYDIEYTHKGIYSKLYIGSVNSNIRNTSRKIAITLNDLNQLYLSVEDNNEKTAVQSAWTGNYKRMSDSLLMDYRTPKVESIVVLEYNLKGNYKNIEGVEIHFDSPQIFTWLENNTERSGSYALLNLNNMNLIEFVFYNRRGMAIERRFYSYVLNQNQDENYIIRSLVLTPGVLTVRGFQASGERNKAYEQMEVVEN